MVMQIKLVVVVVVSEWRKSRFPRNLNCRKNVRESIPPPTPATVPPHVLIVIIRLCGYLSRYVYTRSPYINRHLRRPRSFSLRYMK